MANIRVGIIGAGWPGVKHAEGYQATSGFKVQAIADLIPARRQALLDRFADARQYPSAETLLDDRDIDAVSVCLPNHLHAPIAIAALKGGKHVICETPPSINTTEARRMEAAAVKAKKVLLYAAQRRYGGSEQAARQAIQKGYIGEVYHARAAWMRTRGVPTGTGWFTDKSKSGGGALIDLGVQMLDLAWDLLGEANPQSVYGVTSTRLMKPAGETTSDVEDAAIAMVRFEGGKSLELASSWAINQPPQQKGTICRIHGEGGVIDVYTTQGPAIYRGFGPKGDSKHTILKLPRHVHYPAMMRHFRDCIVGKSQPLTGAKQGLMLMKMIEAIYKSAQSGKSVDVK